jgi:hypothetical protein
MDLRTALLKEHSRNQTLKIADYVGLSEPRFKELVDVYLAGPYRITQRSAWALSLCVERYPHLLKPHFKRILDHLKTPGVHNAAKRNTIRLLQFVEVPKVHFGRVADLCFGYLRDNKEAVAIRVFSMSVLNNLARREPDLLGELRITIEDRMHSSSPAFRSRASKILREIKGSEYRSSRNH